MMAKLTGGTAGNETGRWHGVRREDRVCKECGSGEVEGVGHFVLRCEYVAEERERMERLMSKKEEGSMRWRWRAMKRW